jgi:cytidylate kinase
MIITIDGPVASGKSTIARMVAEKLRFYYVYSGLLYRALAYVLIREHGYSNDTIATPDMRLVYTILDHISYADTNGGVGITFALQDITTALKDASVDQAASIVSGNPAVRDSINQLQRTIAQKHDVVADGRDCGSVVFPHAEHKFFLTAPLHVRARRWQMQQQERGHFYTIQDAEQMLATRDTRDSNRTVAPLVVPLNAIVIDTSQMTIEETLDHILHSMYLSPEAPWPSRQDVFQGPHNQGV